MPFNGNGTFTGLTAPNYPAVAGEVIYAERFNNVINDLIDGLTNCITRDGQSTITANIPMANFVFTGLGAGAASGQSVNYTQWLAAFTNPPVHPQVADLADNTAEAKVINGNYLEIAMARAGLSSSTVATSSTSLAVGTGTKNFTIQTGKNFQVGMEVVAAYTVTPTTRMVGTILSHNSTTGALSVSVSMATGAGTYADWTVSVTAALDVNNFITPDGVQTMTNKTLTSPTISSPNMTNTPTAPTAVAGTNTTQVATTAFVKAAIDALLNSAPGVLDTLDELAAALGDDANFATTMTNLLAAKAPLDSPAFTNNPTAPTQAAGNNSTRLATTAFVQQSLGTLKKQFTADGAITAGDVVVLKDTTGKVAAVGSSTVAGTLHSEQVHLSSSTTYYGCLAIPGTNKWVILYASSVVVGEVDTSTGVVTFGTPQAFTDAARCAMCWHPVESRVVFAYTTAANATNIALGTITGTAIAVSAGTALGTNSTTNPRTCYQTHQNKVLVAITPTSSTAQVRSAHIAADVVTWQGNASLTGGTSCQNHAIAEVPGTPYFLVGNDASSTDRITACQINASTITVGSSGTPSSNPPTHLVWDSVNSCFLGVRDNGNTYYVITPSLVSTAAPTIGAGTAFPGLNINAQWGLTFDSSTGKFVGYCKENSTQYAVTFLAEIVSASAVTVSDINYLNSTTTSQGTTNTMTMVSYNETADRVLFIYKDDGNLNYGTIRVWDSGAVVTDADDWIGIAEETVADAASVWVTLKGGVNINVSGLTVGADYFVADDGSLSQTDNGRPAGMALSATSIFLSGAM